jgi:hypothetical protein
MFVNDNSEAVIREIYNDVHPEIRKDFDEERLDTYFKSLI